LLATASISILNGCGTLKGSNASPHPTYAVVIDGQLYSDGKWRKVVDALRKKHDADLILYDGDVSSVRDPLSATHPTYTCFVADWRRADEDFIVAVHRLTRSLDDDPYTDTIWGVLTGYDSADALRVASLDKPLTVRRVLSGSVHFNLDNCAEGIKFSEGKAGGRWFKQAGGKTVFDASAPVDSTKALVDAMNDFKPDAFYTSGHGNIDSWQIGYNYRDGFFFSQAGKLFGLDTKKRIFPIHSPNTKVYLPCGNCLIGRIQNRNAFSLAMMHSAGVSQMFGYIVPTFNGYMGWGVDVYFAGMRNRYSLSESFFNAEQALIHKLKASYPKLLDTELPSFSERLVFAAANGAYSNPKETKGAAGLLWDKNAVAFYGDPAWSAAYPDKAGAWNARLSRSGQGKFTLAITTDEDGSWPQRPIIAYLPARITNPKITAGKEYAPEITDDFVLLPLSGQFSKGDKVVVEFTAETLPGHATSADSKPISAPRAASVDSKTYFDDSGPLVDFAWSGKTFPVPKAYIPAVSHALGKVILGKARRALPEAFAKAASHGISEEFAFIVANASTVDLNLISPNLFLENIVLAKQARKEAPWGRRIPRHVFFNDVLPYAALTETRSGWRPMLRKRLSGILKGCETTSEAADKLNKNMWRLLGVKYSRKRKQPDQSPEETISSGIASCTGLSILLVDACRAFAIPARVVGTPSWTRKKGNHTWVEIWDGGTWRFLGAYDGAGIDDAWFVQDAANADASNPMRAIYAVSFEKTGTIFPCVWSLWKPSVHAVSRTVFYNALKKTSGKSVKIFVTVLDGNGTRVPAKVSVKDAKGGETASGTSTSEKNDTNDILSLEVPAKEAAEYSIEAEYQGAKATRKVKIGQAEVAKGFERLTIRLP
jgi:zinc protease